MATRDHAWRARERGQNLGQGYPRAKLELGNEPLFPISFSPFSLGQNFDMCELTDIATIGLAYRHATCAVILRMQPLVPVFNATQASAASPSISLAPKITRSLKP